jgi:hypothetical protein
LTKFNLPMKGDKRHLDADWIQNRLKLLSRYAGPSVRHQSVPFDHWLLLCDAATGTAEKQSIERTAESLMYVPVWLKDGLAQHELSAAVTEHIASSTTRLITTRLDSDDMLHPDFARLVRSQVRTGFEGFINPLVGLQYVSGRLYLWPYLASNFISYVEPVSDRGECRTVLQISHDEIYSAAPVRQLVSRPLWLVVTHGGNTSTIAARGIRISSSARVREFPLPPELVIEEDPARGQLLREQVRDASRLGWKALHGESRRRLTGGLRSIRAQLLEKARCWNSR